MLHIASLYKRIDTLEVLQIDKDRDDNKRRDGRLVYRRRNLNSTIRRKLWII